MAPGRPLLNARARSLFKGSAHALTPTADRRHAVLRERRLAEREGFEPSVEFPLHTLSKRAPSTTRTSLRSLESAVYRLVDEPANPNCVTNCVRPLNVPRSLTGTAALLAESSRAGTRQAPARARTFQYSPACVDDRRTVRKRARSAPPPCSRGRQIGSDLGLGRTSGFPQLARAAVASSTSHLSTRVFRSRQ